MAVQPLTCSNCTAPLPEDDDGDGVLRCGYCGRTHRFVTPPPAPKTHQHLAGAAVVVEWHGRWWDGHVLEVVGPDRWKVRYDGWSSRWDEIVGPDRIRDRAQAAGLRRAGRGAPVGFVVTAIVTVVALIGLAIGFSLIRDDQGSSRVRSTPTGAVVTDVGKLRPGQAVEIQWRSSWYAGHVVQVHPDGRVRVHYDGYADSWDEDVPLSRLRVVP